MSTFFAQVGTALKSGILVQVGGWKDEYFIRSEKEAKNIHDKDAKTKRKPRKNTSHSLS